MFSDGPPHPRVMLAALNHERCESVLESEVLPLQVLVRQACGLCVNQSERIENGIEALTGGEVRPDGYLTIEVNADEGSSCS